MKRPLLSFVGTWHVLQAATAALATLLALIVVTFAIGRLLPIDPALAILGDQATATEIAALRKSLRLDDSLPVQFFGYLQQLLQGDLGVSSLTGRPVIADIASRFPATFELATLGMVLGCALGIPAGIYAAAHRGSGFDHLVRIVCVTSYSTPRFWLAILLLLVFYVWLGVSPSPGRVDAQFAGELPVITGFLLLDALLTWNIPVLKSAAAHAALPGLIFVFVAFAPIARLTRAYMLDRLNEEYVLTARAKGLSETRVLWRHAFPATLAPLLNILALTYAALLEGSVLVETVFAWPGLGKYIVDSLFSADMNGVLGGTIVIGVAFIVLNALADFAGRAVDPRTR